MNNYFIYIFSSYFIVLGSMLLNVIFIYLNYINIKKDMKAKG